MGGDISVVVKAQIAVTTNETLSVIFTVRFPFYNRMKSNDYNDEMKIEP